MERGGRRGSSESICSGDLGGRASLWLKSRSGDDPAPGSGVCRVRAGRRPRGAGARRAPRPASRSSIKAILIDQGQIHAEKRSNRVRSPLIGGKGAAQRADGAVRRGASSGVGDGGRG
jgi:hypothetical protein